MNEEKNINYEFDYDDEKKTVRKSIGMICICVGVLLLILMTDFLYRDIKFASTGNKVTAVLEKKDTTYEATYTDDAGVKHKYEIKAFVNILHRKTVSIYYQKKLSEGVFIHWEIYPLSYILYGFILFVGICNLKNKSVFKVLLGLFKKKKSSEIVEENHDSNEK